MIPLSMILDLYRLWMHQRPHPPTHIILGRYQLLKLMSVWAKTGGYVNGDPGNFGLLYGMQRVHTEVEDCVVLYTTQTSEGGGASATNG